MSGLNGLETAILVLGSVFSAASLVFSITGLLELLVILGPISCGCTRISSWWLHNALLLLLWLPTLGISGWLLHEGWPDAVPFVALGAFFVVAHMMLLFCYWLRRTLRKQQAKQLPTQELLTEAQRVMIAGNTETVQIQGRGVLDAQVSGRTDQFQLQVGRTDGAAGFTLYIPGEAEEAVLQDLTAKHYQKRMMTAQAQAPPAPAPAARGALPPTSSFRSSSLRDSANTATGAASPLPASSSMRSLRGANGSPEKNPPGPMNAGADPGHGSRRGGVIQVLLPEALARWNQGRASNRYRVLTDSALPSPAGGPPTATGAAADAVAAVPRSQREFPFTQGDGAQAADGTDDTRDDGEGGMGGGSFQRDGELSGSLVEANNPLFGAENSLGNELSLRASDLMPQAAASGSSSEWRTASPPPAAASDAPTMPTSSGANGVPGFRMHARSMASAGVMSGGSMARHSMDPVLLSPHVLMQPTHGHTLSSDRMNSPWLSQLHLSSSTPDGPAALRGGSLINMTPPTANRLDGGRAGLLDAGQDSSAVVDGGATPEPLHGSGGARAGASHTEGRRIGGGLLGGRLWQAHHNRTRSFPTVSTLTAALLQDQDRSAEAGSSGDLGVEASPRAAVRNVWMQGSQ